MGQIIELKCSKCGYRESENIGQGIRYNRLENVINLFNEQTRSRISKETAAENSMWSAYREIGECRKCKRIVGTTVFTVTDAKGKKEQFISGCSCGGEVSLLNSAQLLSGHFRVSCPKCGGSLEFEKIGRWD